MTESSVMNCDRSTDIYISKEIKRIYETPGPNLRANELRGPKENPKINKLLKGVTVEKFMTNIIPFLDMFKIST